MTAASPSRGARSAPNPAPRQKRRRRGRRRGTLAVIGGLLLASAALRIGIGASEAIALEGQAPVPEQLADTSDVPSAGNRLTTDADLAPVLAALKAREDRLVRRETEIRKRLQALALAEAEIDRKMAELRQAEEDLRATLALAQTAAEDDLTRLTDVYANMKPKQAAALFEEMDPDFAAGFLGRMRADAAAAIMAGLSPRAAYTISVVLAGRNAEVPKE